jgi:hypothetical protein
MTSVLTEHFSSRPTKIGPSDNPTIEDILNGKRDLFMSLKSDVGAFRLISKRPIVFVETQRNGQEIRSLTPHEPQSLVLRFIHAHTLFGAIYPTEQTHIRVSERLNDPSEFQAIYRQGTQFNFNRDLVIYASAG